MLVIKLIMFCLNRVASTGSKYSSFVVVLYNLQVRFCERNYIYTYCGKFPLITLHISSLY